MAAVVLFSFVFCLVGGFFISQVSKAPTKELASQGLNYAKVSKILAGQGGNDENTTSTESDGMLTIWDNSLLGYSIPSIAPDMVMNRKEIIEYTVKSGDTLSIIADEHGVSLNTLLWTNKLTVKSSIKPGQTIEILPISGTKHTVKGGENISLIANKYDVSAEDIIEFNDLPADAFISVGDELVIPGGIPPVVAPPKKTYYASYVSADQEISAGYFIYPTSGRNWGVLHNVNAVDIANSCRTPIYAAAAGTITIADSAGWNSGYGNYVKIHHPNGVETLYGHFSEIVVSMDDKVEQGDLIGYMGTTGHSTGCHLHFEVRGAKNPFVR
jgi:murein DD-endopeptidase MepM/ murein hydrolase activator NlpD